MNIANTAFSQACIESRALAILAESIQDHIEDLKTLKAIESDPLLCHSSEALLNLLPAVHRAGGRVLDNLKIFFAEALKEAACQSGITDALVASGELLDALSSTAQACQQLNFTRLGRTFALPDFTCLSLRAEQLKLSLAAHAKPP